jgi:hypothetical protein
MKKDTIVLTGLTVAALCMGKIIVDMLESNDCSYQAFKFSYPFSDKQKKIIKNQYDDYMGDSVTAEDLEDAKYYRTIAKNLISGNYELDGEGFLSVPTSMPDDYEYINVGVIKGYTLDSDVVSEIEDDE